MLRHVVCIKLKESSVLPEWIGSSQILATIPGVRNFSACPLLKRDPFDCALYMEFENESALRAYQEHPVHRKYLDEVLAQHAGGRMVVDLLQPWVNRPAEC